MLVITWLRECRAGDVMMRDSGWERNLFVKVNILQNYDSILIYGSTI